MTQGPWRYVHYPENPERDALFNLESDPLEKKNLVGASSRRAELFQKETNLYLESPSPPWGEGTPTVELDHMQLNQLRALGYAIE